MNLWRAARLCILSYLGFTLVVTGPWNQGAENPWVFSLVLLLIVVALVAWHILDGGPARPRPGVPWGCLPALLLPAVLAVEGVFARPDRDYLYAAAAASVLVSWGLLALASRRRGWGPVRLFPVVVAALALPLVVATLVVSSLLLLPTVGLAAGGALVWCAGRWQEQESHDAGDVRKLGLVLWAIGSLATGFFGLATFVFGGGFVMVGALLWLTLAGVAALVPGSRSSPDEISDAARPP